MASRRTMLLLVFSGLAMAVIVSSSSSAMAQQLDVGFYSKTCPKVEEIVREEMIRILAAAPTLAGPLLRLHFHDCFVRSKGPYWAVQLGRRDGRISIANETKQLPPPTANITQLIQMFTAKGLDLKDLVVLSGGHTLGTAHCSAFSDRLYNFTGADNAGDVDPALDRSYLSRLRSRCVSLDDNTTLAEMDPGSFLAFDASYYRLVAKRRGLFHSDSSLLADAFTASYVLRQATGLYAAEFFKDFAESMVKMGAVGVLTGGQGEIRKKCYVIN
ncbi:hypothetical protein ABZP36_009851 [Zizania latifolia]